MPLGELKKKDGPSSPFSLFQNEMERELCPKLKMEIYRQAFLCYCCIMPSLWNTVVDIWKKGVSKRLCLFLQTFFYVSNSYSTFFLLYTKWGILEEIKVRKIFDESLVRQQTNLCFSFLLYNWNWKPEKLGEKQQKKTNIFVWLDSSLPRPCDRQMVAEIILAGCAACFLP